MRGAEIDQALQHLSNCPAERFSSEPDTPLRRSSTPLSLIIDTVVLRLLTVLLDERAWDLCIGGSGPSFNQARFGLKQYERRGSIMTKIRLLLVEDNRLLREGLTAMLNEQPDIEVVAAFGNGKEAVLKATQELKPQIILLDSGVEGSKQFAPGGIG